MKFFYKNEMCKRVLSMVLAFVMIFTMFAAQLPSGLLEVQAAENEKLVTFYRSDNDGKVNGYSWYFVDGTKYEPFGGWSGAAMTKDGDYYKTSTISIPSVVTKIYFIANGNGQTKDIEIDISDYIYGDAGYEVLINGEVPTDKNKQEVISPEVISPEVNGTDVTFRYYYAGTETVYLRGSMTDWANNQVEMTKGANNVHECTITLAPGEYQYKFWYDDNSEYGMWSTDPNNTAQKDGNSVVNVVDASAPTIVSPEVNGTDVTFRYYYAGTETVYLRGSMTDWANNQVEMTKGANNVHECTITLAPGEYQYKFWYDDNSEYGMWSTDPNNTAQKDGNSVVNVVDASAPVIVSPEINGKNVTFRYYAPEAETVHVSGTMNGWNTTANPMTKKDNGVFELTLELDYKGYSYKFVIDGDYEEGNDRTFEVVDPDEPQEEPIEVVNPEINGTRVTFRYYAPKAKTVHVSGTMNGWNTTANPMKKGDNGVFELTLTLPENNYEYKFVIDGDYEGGNNRTFEVIDDSLSDYVPISNYYARDVIEVEIGGEVYSMSPFTGGVFETVVELEAGTYNASLIVNGVAPMSATETEIVVENAGKVAIRLTDEGLTATPVEFVALAGNIDTLSSDYANWNPGAESGQLTYLGNGLYMGTFKFAELTTEKGIEYKVVFGGSWGGREIADNGQNIKTTIPAGRTSFTVLVDANAGTIINDVDMDAIKVNGADKNPLTTTVSLIGTVRGLGGDDWNTGVKGYEFTRISDTLYRYEMTLGKGTHSYKAVFDYSDWYDIEGSGNRIITLTKDDVKVVFLYDAASGYLFDTVNNEEKVASLLGMKARPAEMEIIENANGTATFVAVAKAGQKVTLYYGEKTEVEANGAAALTKVTMGAVSNGKSSSEELWLGDAALDLVYYYDINGTRTLDGSKPVVTIGGAEFSNYARPAYEGRVINVPGTFPGPSWDAASNQMTYNGNRTYSYTFKNVPAAKYEFKIAVNGSWAENYGVGGAFDGGNMKVSVPTAQDVTIYYSDVTHYAVNSIDYKFANITLTGKNIPEGTKLTDEGLTGIYSVTVTLPAGTYNDVVINCDGTEYKVAEFKLNQEKAVTFCMDPVTSIFYHDASNVKIETAEIFFDSKDAEYKSVFGAIATGEEVTFTLATGEDVSSASLVIKGNENKSVAMTKAGEALDGVQKWNATVSLSSIGEYGYYFVVSNGASVQCYGDDDGYYGVGTVAELTDVQPYDLVVYEAGFETPDWMKNAVIYQIFPDRFYDGDASNNHAQESARGAVDYEFIDDWYTLPENPEQEGILDKATYESTGAFWGDGQWSNEIYGGDLEGITERIDYLKALGVTVIYLNPVFSSISNHRYDACDYTEIDPILGTEGDFAELVRVAEKNGMKVVLDGVFNHVSDDSIYFDRYYKFIDDGLDTIGAYPYWAFVYDYMAENDADKATAEKEAKEYFTAEYGITDYSYVEWFDVFQTSMKDGNGNAVCDTIGQRAGKPVYGYDGWWGYDSMPIIKSTNGSEYQTGDWAEEIIYNEDGTSVTQYWISQGMDGWRLDVANEVSDETWQRFRESVKALNNGEAVIIGEIWDDAAKYILGDMYDSVMNYMFRNAVTGFAMGTNAEETTKYMERLRERYPEEAFYAMMNLVGSHDTTRILSYLDGIGDDRNQKDINSAFPTYENTSWDAKQRQYLVAFLQFTYAGAPTIYYGDEIGMVGSDDPDDRRAFEWGQGNKELVTYYATLAEVRDTYSALRTGSVETFDAGNNNVLAYVRRDAKNEIIVLANNGTSAATVTLDLAELDVDAKELRDLLDDSVAYEVSGDKATVTVAARRGVILVDKHAVKNIKVNEKALAVAYDEKYVVPEVSERHYDKPEQPNKPSNPSTPGNSGNSGNSDEDSVTTPVRPSQPTRPGNTNRPGRAEEELVEIEDTDTPLADGQTEDVQEEKEPVEVETEIVEEEVPLTAGAEETSAMPMIVVIAVLLAACGGALIILQKRKAIVK